MQWHGDLSHHPASPSSLSPSTHPFRCNPLCTLKLFIEAGYSQSNNAQHSMLSPVHYANVQQLTPNGTDAVEDLALHATEDRTHNSIDAIKGELHINMLNKKTQHLHKLNMLTIAAVRQLMYLAKASEDGITQPPFTPLVTPWLSPPLVTLQSHPQNHPRSHLRSHNPSSPPLRAAHHLTPPVTHPITQMGHTPSHTPSVTHLRMSTLRLARGSAVKM